MRKPYLLLVEDNEGDIFLTKEAFEEKNIVKSLSIVTNGKDAIDFIFRQNKFQDSPIPDLVLLDINLPFKNGHEVLEIVKSNEQTKHIPIIILTTSSSEKDINKAYKNYANCYISKPLEDDDFMYAIESIEDFWLKLTLLPQQA